jgi:hypothetical protein
VRVMNPTEQRPRVFPTEASEPAEHRLGVQHYVADLLQLTKRPFLLERNTYGTAQFPLYP